MSFLELIVDFSAAFAALAAVLFVLLRRKRGRAPVGEQTPAAPPEPGGRWDEDHPWDEDAALRRLVDETAELRTLYGKLGSLPEVEREVERIVAELKGLIRAEVPDFAAFDAALTEAEAQLAAPAEDAPDRPRFRAENEALLRAVLAVRGDHDAVLRLLNEDPVDQLLPVVEQIPMVRNGEVIWRTPMELTLVRKRPARPDRFERLLDELDWLVRSARLRRRPAAREAVLAAIVRLRRDAARENAYLPTPMQTLLAEVDGWLHRSLDAATRRRREELDDLLRGLLRVRHDLETAHGTDLRETSRAQAQLYATQPWWHTPWLTSTLLANLLDTELAALLEKERARPGAPAHILRLVRDEVVSQHYDSDESIRRLRQQEERGLFLHSLVYALLRMNRLPAAVVEEGVGIPRSDSGEQSL